MLKKNKIKQPFRFVNLLCAVAPNAISREQNININPFIATL